jgi:glycosyltransferase involved in cell wall biosynthesis
VFKLAVVKSQKIIVPAQAVLDDFLKYYPNSPKEKYVIAQEGIDPDIQTADVSRGYEVLDKFGIKKPFLLYISSMYEHKNVPLLIQAFEELINKYNYKGQLVLVGKKDKFSENVSQLVFNMGLDGRVLLPGMRHYINDEETSNLRKECDVYVFPSLKEGFSLTPMEAQYFGKACVISDIPIHKEVYGESVLYFDPLNVDDMAEKINTVLTDSDIRQDLINKGYKNILKYSWDETADVTLGVFNQVLKNS